MLKILTGLLGALIAVTLGLLAIPFVVGVEAGFTWIYISGDSRPLGPYMEVFLALDLAAFCGCVAGGYWLGMDTATRWIAVGRDSPARRRTMAIIDVFYAAVLAAAIVYGLFVMNRHEQKAAADSMRRAAQESRRCTAVQEILSRMPMAVRTSDALSADQRRLNVALALSGGRVGLYRFDLAIRNYAGKTIYSRSQQQQFATPSQKVSFAIDGADIVPALASFYGAGQHACEPVVMDITEVPVLTAPERQALGNPATCLGVGRALAKSISWRAGAMMCNGGNGFVMTPGR